MNGYIADLTIPRTRKLHIRFSVFDKWQLVKGKVLIAITNAYLLGRSCACDQVIAESFGQPRYPRSLFQRLTKRFEKKLEVFKYIGKMLAYSSKFNYFHGKPNLDLALFSCLCFKKMILYLILFRIKIKSTHFLSHDHTLP